MEKMPFRLLNLNKFHSVKPCQDVKVNNMISQFNSLGLSSIDLKCMQMV